MAARPSSIADLTTPAAARSQRDAIDRLDDGYFELDRDFRYRRINAAAARIVQMSPAEMLGQHVWTLFPQVEPTALGRAMTRAMARRRGTSVETRFPPDHRWYVNSVYPITDGIAVFTREITEQKLLEQNLSFLAQASKALSASLDYTRTLRNVAKLAVPHIADWCAVEIRTGPTSVDQLAVAHIDPKKVKWARELRASEPVDLSAPTGLPNVLRTGRSEFYPVITDEMIVAAAKDERHLELIRSLGFSSVMIVPLLIQGEAIGGITLVTAESGRHYTKADLAMAEELASRAALAIQNARLYTESQQAVTLRNDFISAASHELKTPVTSLKVYTEVLQKQAERRGDEPLGRSLRKMDAQIDKLSVLIGDLLDVSKIEAGKLELASAPVDLNRVTGEVIEAIQPTAAKHRIVVEGAIARPVRGDHDRLGQVLTNLLTNAVKYSPQADRVVVRLSNDKGNAAIEVEDFGIGIDRKHVGKIFDLFYRVSSPDEKTFPGLGIGLFISNEIVRRHGGNMKVKSTKGRGSVFRVLLPNGNPAGSRGGGS